ncbi:tyrosinase-like protein [Podospora didyma]|uniref:Tyrosinase-like protein n=1 Tax=Podospora didyma TaxID=330526 RepID=A0AAE0K5G9_9PEZI|nr:tyrosinase-like protein [Podospora didyma]
MILPKSSVLCLAAALSGAANAAADLPKWAQPAVDSGLALGGLNGIALVKALGETEGTCNIFNIKYRQEWRTLSATTRKSFIAAAKCVQKKPSLLPAGQIPGAKTMWDDFVFVHMSQTPTIHLTGNFLTWHRYFLQTFEKKLQECGYNGNLPYWEWGLDVNSLQTSPLFDGSTTSLGSDGVPVPHQGMQILMPFNDKPVTFKAGTGGGCLTSGPFSDLVIHLGPVAKPAYGSNDPVGQADPTQDNPRCLSRDLSSDTLKRFSSFRNTTELIIGQQTVETFQALMSGDPRYILGDVGVHGGGHDSVGGEMSDPFTSPNDPLFYLHHAQIDRVYWIWQMQDFNSRQGVSGTQTLLNLPPSLNTTVEDLLNVAPLNNAVKIKDMMNTVGGPLCYVYI